MKINIAHIEEESLIYGPGIRFVIWTQGCSIRCKNCWNQDMWNFNPKTILTIQQLYEKIISQNNIEGMTILGGEPLDQYLPVLNLIKKIKNNTNLSIILYTGYTIKQLQRQNKTEVINYVDILITGPYIEKYRTLEGGLIGSTNQKILFITDRYSILDLPHNNECEISIDENGKIIAYGYYKEDLKDILNLEGER